MSDSRAEGDAAIVSEAEAIRKVVSLCVALAASEDPLIRQSVRRLLPALLELHEEVDLSSGIASIEPRVRPA